MVLLEVIGVVDLAEAVAITVQKEHDGIETTENSDGGLEMRMPQEGVDDDLEGVAARIVVLPLVARFGEKFHLLDDITRVDLAVGDQEDIGEDSEETEGRFGTVLVVLPLLKEMLGEDLERVCV